MARKGSCEEAVEIAPDGSTAMFGHAATDTAIRRAVESGRPDNDGHTATRPGRHPPAGRPSLVKEGARRAVAPAVRSADA
jgi:hypothetical protein